MSCVHVMVQKLHDQSIFGSSYDKNAMQYSAM